MEAASCAVAGVVAADRRSPAQRIACRDRRKRIVDQDRMVEVVIVSQVQWRGNRSGTTERIDSCRDASFADGMCGRNTGFSYNYDVHSSMLGVWPDR